MTGKTVAILGATGMIGELLLELALNDPYFERVRVLVRKPFSQKHPKLEVKLVDFKDAESVKLALEETDIILSAIGTTQKNVGGDEKRYYEIDFDIPVNAARFGKEAEVKQMAVISAVGANSRSRNFYLKLKGEVENALIEVELEGMHLMQPSQLIGKRKEFRLAERIITPIMQVVSLLFIGSAKKFKAIHGSDVAKAMIAVVKKEKKGAYRYTYEEMIKLAK